jgi:hypothetical protein
MLSDRVVIEAEVRRELGDVNWCACIGDVPEDAMACGIPERSCLFLQIRHFILLRALLRPWQCSCALAYELFCHWMDFTRRRA